MAAVAKFTFRFTVSNEVPAGGIIEIGFPLKHFEVPSSERVSRLSVAGGPWIVPQQTILQTSIWFFIVSAKVPAGAEVTLEIADMANPNTME